MKGEFMPGLTHSLEKVKEKEEKQKGNTSYLEKTDGDQVSSQYAREQQTALSKSPSSVRESNSRKRNADLASQLPVPRSSGGKDRHSKVNTSKGLRDRRVRLSVSTAIQFYDIQDRLGYDQPSKAVEWLMKNAKTAIDELPSPADFRQDSNVAGTYCLAPPSSHDVLKSPSGFLIPSLATQQQFITCSGTDSNAASSTLSNTSTRGGHGIPYAITTSTSTIPSKSETRKQATQDSVPKILTSSAFGSSLAGAWIDSEKPVQRTAIMNSSFIGDVRAEHPSMKIESRTKARESGRDYMAPDSVNSIKREPLLPDHQNDPLEAPTEGVFERTSSRPFLHENQILTSFFQNEDSISRMLRNNISETLQNSQMQELLQINQGPIYSNDSKDGTSTPSQADMRDVVSAHDRPATSRMDLTPVSSPFARTYSSLFPENPHDFEQLKSNPFPNYFNHRSSLQEFLTAQQSMNYIVDPAGSHTSSPRSSASIRSLPLANYIPSVTMLTPSTTSASDMSASFGSLPNKNFTDPIHSFTENDSSLMSFDKYQSAFRDTSNVTAAEAGHQGRYPTDRSSFQREERFEQMKRRSLNEYGLLDDIMIMEASQSRRDKPRSKLSFTQASSILQEQSKLISGQLTAHSESSNVHVHPYSPDYNRRESANEMPYQNLFRTSRTPEMPERQLEGIFDELEEQLIRHPS